MATSERDIRKIIDMLDEGYSSRFIAEKVLGSGSKKSTVNDIRNRLMLPYTPDENLPKILLIDLESSAALVGAFQRWDVNVSQAQVFQEVMLLGFAAKWLGEDEIIEVYPTRFSNWETDEEQQQMLEKAWRLFDQADFVIAHNGIKFDIPMFNAQFIRHGFGKPSPYKPIDTLRIARRNFKFPSNSLDNLGEYLNLGRKVKHSGFALWRGCMLGETASFREMIEYNVGDITLLESVYMALRAWDSQHPNVSFHYEDDGQLRCGVCGDTDLQDTGKKAYTAASEFSLYKCGGCGAWHRSRKRNKRVSELLVGAK